MNIYTFEARDTVLFRDARPFTGSDGAHSMATPWPSTIAGLFRTRLGQDENGNFDPARIPELLNTSIIGPWLVELDDNNGIKEFYVPAPQDSVFFSDEGKKDTTTVRYTQERLHPELSLVFASDLRTGDGAKQLLPLTFANKKLGEVKGKPARGPAWWSWSTMQRWLDTPDALTAKHTAISENELKELGAEELESEERVHVAIDSETLTASDGNLFITSMRRMTQTGDVLGSGIRRFAFAGGVETPVPLPKRGELVGLGGERRLSTMRHVEKPKLPKAPTITSDTIRVILVTPGLFEQGWRPSDDKINNAELIGAAVDRWESVSGWDFDKNQPKPARRMARAGSVYWLKFDSLAAAQEWAEGHHFTAISDDPQDVRDGFGLCLVGNV